MIFNELDLKSVQKEIIDYRGKTPKKLGGDWANDGYRALSAKNIKTGKIVQEESIRYVDQELYNKWMKQEVEKGTILITSEAPFGEMLYWDSDEKIVLSQRLFGVKIKEEYCSKYIYYYMISKTFQDEMSGRATGSTVTGLRQPELLKCKIRVPSYDNQMKIAKILSSIDDKIKISNEINNNLQEYARNLFDENFSLKETNGSLKDIVKMSRKTIKKENKDLSLRYFPVDVLPMNYLISKEGKDNEEAQSSLIAFDKNDILIGAMRVYFHRVCLAREKGITRTTTFVLKPVIPEYLYYSLLLMDKNAFIDYASLTSKGSTMPYAVWENGIADYSVYVPDIQELEEFNKILKPIFEKCMILEEENETLSQLRDTLLPKLMNGEIDLDSVEI